jgi:capsular polysaccharide transport system permease protein
MAEFPYFRRNRGLASTAIAGVRTRPRALDAVAGLFGLINIWFWAIVGLPTLIAAVYCFGMASDLYQSEVQFIIRAPSKASPLASIAGGLLGGAIGSVGNDDTYAVTDFILSRDAVHRLEAEVNLRAMFDRPEGDAISRFPGALSLGRKDFEALYKAYARFVSVEIDNQSGIATLEVKAYRPEDAQTIARALLTYSEELINTLNDRARKDALTTFEHEVATTQAGIEKVQGELTDYRVKQNMLDPKSAAAGPLELLATLIAQQTTARTQLADLLKNAPHNPQIPLVQTRIASLEKQITDQRAKITGSDNSVATASAEYERLTVDLGLDEKALASAFASREGARLEAQRQQLYLETIVQPGLADYPIYPRRVVNFMVFTVSCLLIYAIAWLLIAAVREHAAA